MSRWLTLCLIAALPCLATAEQPQLDQLFVDANHAYETGDYPGAVAIYDSILEDDMSAAALYNLGNAYYQLGEYGKAILAYARALVLDADNPDTLANLALAQEAAQMEGPERVWSENYAQSLNVNAWTWMAVIGFWGTLALILLPPLYGWRSPWRALLLAICIIALGAGGIGLYGYHQLSKEGIVLANDSPLQLAPTTNSPASTFLQAGATADVQRVHGGYAYIETPGGDKGWISLDLFGKIWR